MPTAIITRTTRETPKMFITRALVEMRKCAAINRPYIVNAYPNRRVDD